MLLGPTLPGWSFVSQANSTLMRPDLRHAEPPPEETPVTRPIYTALLPYLWEHLHRVPSVNQDTNIGVRWCSSGSWTVLWNAHQQAAVALPVPLLAYDTLELGNAPFSDWRDVRALRACMLPRPCIG